MNRFSKFFHCHIRKKILQIFHHKHIHNTLIMLPHYRGNFEKKQNDLESITVSKLGVTDLIFVDPGIKVNGERYREVLLSQKLLPAIREMSGDFFVFQQDSAPAHRT